MNQTTNSDDQHHVFKPLSGRKILFGVSGGIACFKAAEYVRNLMKEGAEVQVVLTANACKFVTENSFSALSGKKSLSRLFDSSNCYEIPHIKLARQSDLFVVVPATADIMAKFAHGIADDLPSTLFLSFTGTVILFPSMNPDMFAHPATQANIAILKQRGTQVVEPETGTVVCGARGRGRLPGWEKVLFQIKNALWSKPLAGKKILVTAGPTREPVDPVRFLSNRSSGKMGFRLAEAASLRGGTVNLVTGPVALQDPMGVNVTRVETSRQMADAVFSLSDQMDIVIMAAAVSDYAPATFHSQKFKKSAERLNLELARTTDILMEVGRKKTGLQVLAGFCAESQNLLQNAFKKLRKKNLDLIIANDITEPGAGFDSDTNRVLIIDAEENVEELPMLDKAEVSERILTKILKIMAVK